MCGRFTLTRDTEALAEELDAIVDPGFDWKARYNIAPSQLVPVLVRAEDGKRHLVLKKWGLVPAWAKDPSIGHKMINARIETAALKPAFRKAFINYRCVVPADSFYEWKGEGKRKAPIRILAKSGELFAFAGLWDEWRAPNGGNPETFTILTTEAQGPLRSIHTWVPVILSRDQIDAWLSSAAADAVPGRKIALRAYAVSPSVNSPKHDDPDCIEPLSAQSPVAKDLKLG